MKQNLVIFVSLLIIASCGNPKLEGEECLDEHNFQDVIRSLDLEELDYLSNADFYIEFNSHDSWGTFNNTIKVIQDNSDYISNATLILRTDRTKNSDTIFTTNKLKITEVDSLINQINKLSCQPYQLKGYNAVDGNYQSITYKNNGVIKKWKWGEGGTSRNKDGVRVIDSIKVKAIGIEGLIYRLTGAGGPKVVYAFDKECINDSIGIDVYHTWGDYTTKNIIAEHPDYTFRTNKDGYISKMIKCTDTLSLFKTLKLYRITKEGKKVSVERASRYQKN